MFDTSNCAGFTVEPGAAGLGVAWLGCDYREKETNRKREKSHACAVKYLPETIITISRLTQNNISVSQELTFVEN